MKWNAPNCWPENLMFSCTIGRRRDIPRQKRTRCSRKNLNESLAGSKNNLWSISILTHFELINGFPSATIARRLNDV